MEKSFQILIFFLVVFGQNILAGIPLAELSQKSLQEDRDKIALAKVECENLKVFGNMANTTYTCGDDYFHFESNTKQKPSTQAVGTVKISNFNILHPGTSKTLFKDYKFVAKIVNRFDILSANELLATVGSDASFNRSLAKFLNDGPLLIEKYQKEMASAKTPRQAELKAKIKKLKEDLALAPSLYKVPGYYKLLKELRALDASWSLVLSPRGDSLLLGSVEEYVGFYYRKSRVNLKDNPYCAQKKSGTQSSACLITMRGDFGLGDVGATFSRRPMVVSFTTGSMNFTYLSSHLVFNAYGDEQRMSDLLQTAFGTDVFEEIGLGINEENYARWVEMTLISKWMNGFKKKFPQEKLLFGGDTNLDPNLGLWDKVLKNYHAIDAVIGNTEKTTISPRRFNSKKEETLGLANSYDHFLYKKSDFPNCKEPKSFNFMNNEIAQQIKDKYFVRDDLNLIQEQSQYHSALLNNPPADGAEEDTDPVDTGDIQLDYKLTRQNEKKMNLLLDSYQAELEKDFLIRNSELVIDQAKNAEKLEAYKVRVFMKQLTNLNFYKVYQEVISDHLPIYMDCTVN